MRSPVLWLVISLIVNAGLAGVVVGGSAAHSRSVAAMWPDRGHLADSRHRPGHKAISKKVRRELRRELAHAWRQAREERADLHATRARVREIIDAESLDEVKLKTALSDLYAARANLAEHTRDVIVARLADLPAHERKSLMRMIETLPEGPRCNRQGKPSHN